MKKKLFLLLMAILATIPNIFAVQSTIYICGDASGKINGKQIGGDPGSSVAVTGNNGTFNFTVEGTTAWWKISTKNSGWDDFNNYGFCVKDQSDFTWNSGNLNVTKNLYWGSAQNMFCASTEKYDVTIVIYGDNKGGSNHTMIMKKAAETPTYPDKLYIHIGRGTWDTGTTMTKTDEGKFTFTGVEVPAKTDTYFYFTPSGGTINWNSTTNNYGCSGSDDSDVYIPQANTTTTKTNLQKGAKNAYKAYVEDECTYDVAVDLTANSVTFTKKAAVVNNDRVIYLDLTHHNGAINPNNTIPKAYLWQNSSNGSNSNGWPGVQMESTGTNTYKLDYPSSKNYDRVIFTAGNDGPQTIDLVLTASKTYVIGSDKGTGDNSSKYIEYVEEVVDPVPAHLYIASNITGDNTSNWKFSSNSMTKTGNTFTATIVANNKTSVGNFVCFYNKVVTKFDGNDSYRYGANSDVTLTANDLDKRLTDIALGKKGVWKLPSAGTYTVTVGFKADGSAEYVIFSLQNEEDEYVYFNPGVEYYTLAEWRTGNNLSNTTYKNVYAYFWTEDGTNEDSSKLLGGTNGQLMTRVDNEIPLFRAKIPAGAARRVTFMSSATYKNCNNDGRSQGESTSNNDIIYHSVRSNTSDYNPNYVAADWKKYIYGPGGKGWAVQSFLTYDEYVKRSSNKYEADFVYLGYDGKWGVNVESDYTSAKNYDGLYTAKLKFTHSNFKMSYINPFALSECREADGSAKTNLNDQRMWATFNQGLIGCEGEYYVKSGNNYVKNYVTYNNTSRYYDAYVRQTLTYNHYNNFDWKNNGPMDTDYWVVVDVRYGTVCILDFDPMPTLSIEPNTNAVHDLKYRVSDDDHAAIENIVVPGSGEGANEAYFRFVNNISGEVAVTAAEGSNVMLNGTNNGNTFTVDYDITYEGESLGDLVRDTSCNPNYPIWKSISSMVIPGTNESLADVNSEVDNVLTAQTLFTDTQRYKKVGTTYEPLQFRSNTRKTEAVSGKIELSAPTEARVVFVELYNADSDPGYFDALIGVKYTLPMDFIMDSEAWSNKNDEEDEYFSVYPSFDITVGGKQAQIAPETTYTKNHPSFRTGGSAQFTDKYEFPTEGGAIGVDSWAYQSVKTYASASEGYLPLYIPNVIKQSEVEKGSINLPIRGEVIASYPFRVFTENNVGDSQKHQARRKVVALADDIQPGEGQIEGKDEYEENPNASRIIIVPMGANLTGTNAITISGLSSIVDVFAPAAAAGEGELYNLQGVRVLDANPAAGVYIRRAADGTATKVYVR